MTLSTKPKNMVKLMVDRSYTSKSSQILKRVNYSKIPLVWKQYNLLSLNFKSLTLAPGPLVALVINLIFSPFFELIPSLFLFYSKIAHFSLKIWGDLPRYGLSTINVTTFFQFVDVIMLQYSLIIRYCFSISSLIISFSFYSSIGLTSFNGDSRAPSYHVNNLSPSDIKGPRE